VLEAAFPHEPWFRGFLIEPKPVGSGCIAQVYLGQMLWEAGGSTSSSSSAKCAPAATPCTQGHGCLGPVCRLLRGSLPTVGFAADAQCGRAVKVAVKVVHPQVRRAVEIDLRVMEKAADFTSAMGME
ncbi:unnamed protein product, partial [Polarella glacialis]